MKKLLMLAALLPSILIAQNDWENPAVNSINREPMRSTFDHYANYDSAKIYGAESPMRSSLNGEWLFNYVHNADERPMDFYSPSFDSSQWSSIVVPGAWELQGFGQIIFTNMNYPIEHNPPHVKGMFDNGTPVGSYLRTFTLPKGWDAHEIYISLGGVSSAYYLWINGQKVGYAEDSFLNSDFNITKYLKEGENSIALEVYRWCDGSYLEDQDGWRTSGILRDVDLLAIPKCHIADLLITNELDDSYTDAKTSVKVDLSNLTSRRGKYSVEVTMLDGDKVVNQGKSSVAIGAGAKGSATINLNMSAPKKWSCESPNLYNVVVVLKDSKGGVVDVINRRTGYRKMEIANRVFRLNGQPIKMKGVCRVASSPFEGKTESKERLLEEILIMKRNNINTIRTSHMPAVPYLYDLCDEYGIMVVDEANVESHGMGYFEESLAKFPEWEHSHVERGVRMIRRDVNHPSILMWSLGNEAGNGVNMAAMHKAMKEADPTRPTHYHFSDEPISCDVLGGGFFRFGKELNFGRYIDLIDFPLIDAVDDARPYMLNEYAHAKGNGMGVLKRYVDLFDYYDWSMGGTIWDWVEQSIVAKTDDKSIMGMLIPEEDRAYALEQAKQADGEYFFVVGGDYGDKPNDYDGINDGIVRPDLSRTSKLDEVSKCYQDIEFYAVDVAEGRFEVYNKYYFTSLAPYYISWSLLEDGQLVEMGRIAAFDLEPRSRTQITLPLSQMSFSEGCEYVVVFSAHLRESNMWADKGHRVAWEQFVVKPWDFDVAIAPSTSAPRLEQSEQRVVVGMGNSRVEFDATTAQLDAVWVGDKQIVARAMELDFSRASVDNDGNRLWSFDNKGNYSEPSWPGRLTDMWQKAGYLNMSRTNAALTARIEGNNVVVDATYRLEGAKEEIYFDVAECYTFNSEGEFSLATNIAVSPDAPQVARVGYELCMERGYDIFTYYGQGEIDGYVDRNHAAAYGRWSNSVDHPNNFTHFVTPQESGNKYNVRWATLLSAGKQGIAVQGREPIESSVRRFETRVLDSAVHTTDLKPMDKTIWNINHKMAPLGNESCGPHPQPEYILDDKEWSFTLLFSIKE